MQNEITSIDETSVFNLVNILQDANVVVQAVVAVLMILSVYSWSIIIRSFFNLKVQRKKIRGFNALLNADNCPIDAVQSRACSVKRGGCIASDMINAATRILNCDNYRHDRSRLEDSMRIEIERGLFSQEKYLAGLANVSSLSPFIGLFGTIIGIMHSFSSIFTMQSISLKIIAPSISEALFATAVGIFVAVPAGLFYNQLVNEARFVRSEAEALICYFAKHY